MMVLASVYLSVSASLPPTSDIKPVEVWLIFNLAYPFLNILTNVLLQVFTRDHSDTPMIITLLTFLETTEQKEVIS